MSDPDGSPYNDAALTNRQNIVRRRSPGSIGARHPSPQRLHAQRRVRGEHIVGLRHHWAVWIGPAVLLVLAQGNWPYGYYMFLRLVVCAAAGFLAWQQWQIEDRLSGWIAGLIGICLLFNPIVPIHLSRSLWRILDLGTAVVLLLHLKSIRDCLGQATPISEQSEPDRSATQRLVRDTHNRLLRR